MSGTITKEEVKQNRKLIIDNWGYDFYLACLDSEGKTFLGLLVEHGKM